MIIRYAEEKNFIELRQFYDGMPEDPLFQEDL